MRTPLRNGHRHGRWVTAVVLVVAALGGCSGQSTQANPVEDAIERHFGTLGDKVVEQAKRVAWCESRWDPDARNGDYLGLFQLGPAYYDAIRSYGDGKLRWSDPDVNAQAARDGYVMNDKSWAQWECKP